MQIIYTPHDKIDKIRWDHCIKNAVNGNLYAWSWYLDAVSENWDALISEDYQYVMPLTWRQKWGLKYLYRPLLSQQLGVFSTKLIDHDTVYEFLQHIPKKFKLVEITLNKYNTVRDSEFESSQHVSCELDLIADYTSLFSAYNQNTKRNLKKIGQNSLVYDTDVQAEDFLALMWEDSSAGSAILLQTDHQILLQTLLKHLKQHQAGRIMGARNPGGKLIAAVLFGFSHNKWYYLAPVNSDLGRENKALFGLIDTLIQEQSGGAITLDFEGSDIQGVARFYQGFGANPYHYSFIRRNNLPWPIRLFKG